MLNYPDGGIKGAIYFLKLYFMNHEINTGLSEL